MSDSLEISPEDLESFDSVVGSEESGALAPPPMWSGAWQAYVQSQFEEGDCFQDRPTAFALRKAVEKILGPVVRTKLDVIKAEDGYAVVVSNIAIRYSNGDLREFSGSAEVNRFNTDDTFLAFAVATAETRAVGRALKTALAYKGLTAEEVPRDKNPGELMKEEIKKMPTDGTYNEKEAITDLQIKTITKMCGKLGIDPKLLAKASKDKINELKEATKATGTLMLEKLNEWANDPASVPAALQPNKE